MTPSPLKLSSPPALVRRKLPIGIQTFSEIIEEGHYYVDKSGAAVRLVDEASTTS
jgi:hypothetical protein